MPARVRTIAPEGEERLSCHTPFISFPAVKSVTARSLRMFATKQHSVFSQAQAVLVGATAKELRHEVEVGRFERVGRLVFRVAGSQRTPQQQLMIAQLAAGAGAVVSHRSAAALLGVPGFAFGPIELTAPRGVRRRIAGARIFQSVVLPVHHVRVIDEIPVTSYARTLFDLAGLVHPMRAERALDNCLSRRLVSMPACWRVFADLAEHGRSGSATMRELLGARGNDYVAPASELEAQLLDLLHHAGLPTPAREIDLGDADQWIGRVELVYRDQRVLIEADSRLHHSALLDRRADEQRDKRFRAAGWDVLRFTWEQVTKHPSEVVAKVRAALRRAA